MARRAFDETSTTEIPAQPFATSGVRGADARQGPVQSGAAPKRARRIGSLSLDRLAVEFDPIVDLRTGATEGYEVLARDAGAERSTSGDLFARAALERRAGELGRAIRDSAVRECAGRSLYLYAHPSELREHYLVQPDDPIFAHDARIYLQLAQPALDDLALQVVRELRSRGSIALAIDDFGAGPATLKQLVDLEPGAVKLNRELIAGLDRSRRQQIVVRAIVAVCAQLGARVLAKGVDCESEAEAARDCGVVLAQGYALGEPSPLPAISMWPPLRS